MIQFLAQAAPVSPESAPDPATVTDTINEVTNSITGAADKTMYYIETYGVKAVVALLLIFAAFILASWARRITMKCCTTAKIETTLTQFFGKLARWAVLVMAFLSILSYFGVQTTSFAAVIGAMTLAIGLAFQGTLGNFASGIMLLIFRPFKVGDVIKSCGELGTVNEIDLFSTTLDTFDNRRVILPNGQVFGAVIENITHHELRRVDVSVGVDYSADIDQTRTVLEQAIADVLPMDEAVSDPESAIILLELGGSSVDWQVRVWGKTANYFDVKQALIRAVKIRLDEASIGIPYPQMDVHIDGVVSQTSS